MRGDALVGDLTPVNGTGPRWGCTKCAAFWTIRAKPTGSAALSRARREVGDVHGDPVEAFRSGVARRDPTGEVEPPDPAARRTNAEVVDVRLALGHAAAYLTPHTLPVPGQHAVEELLHPQRPAVRQSEQGRRGVKVGRTP
jgi:hypothetical protein